MSKLVCGVDVGGTFTDFVSYNMETKELKAWKNLSTPADPIKGVLKGLDLIKDKGDIHQIRHGTTIATNAILERKGVTVAYVTTKGFRDIPFIGRGNRRGHYDLHWVKTKPLCLRKNCFEIEERINYKGDILIPLKEEEIKKVAEQIKQNPEIKAIAVSTLFSYVNPVHELKIKEYFNKYLPEIPVSTSFEVLPKWKEYERACTTIADAYIRPLLAKYADRIIDEFKKNNIPNNIVIIKSNGGLMTLEGTKESPIHTAVSGPTGGVVAAKYIAKICDTNKIVTYDMGGTSTDVAVVVDGQEQFTTNFEIVWGLPIQIPMIDIRTIGAGGGSIAWIDKGGMLNVGPQSAGADPGPASYGQGGFNATVTDANVVLGRINPDYFLGGTMKLDKEAAVKAVENIAKQLNMTVEKAALAIVAIANNNMVGALRNVLIEQGYDPRDFSLLSFGGAGSLHAVDMADLANIKEVIVPNNPGQFSAMGFLLTDARVDLQRTVQMTSARFDCEKATNIFKELKENGRKTLEEQKYVDNLVYQTSIELRYLGQNYELDIPFDFEEITPDNVNVIWDSFNKTHNERFGFMIEGEPMEVVNFKATITSITDKPEFVKLPKATNAAVTKDERKVIFDSGTYDTKVYDRYSLLDGHVVQGPALIEENASVTVVRPGYKVEVDAYGNLRVSKN